MGIKAFNQSGDAFRSFFGRAASGDSTGLDAVIPYVAPTSGLTATGGIISDYTTSPGDIYRAHVFTSSGTFTVSAIGDYPAAVEYLVVAGGGAGGGVQPGGSYHGSGGGGGAGGLRTNLSGHPLAGSAFPVSTSPGSYTVTVGAGGHADTGTGANGSNSVFGPITSAGGGGGAGGVAPGEPGGNDGGSGGGGSRENNTTGSGNTPPSSPSQGNDGGGAQPNGGDGGGGGGAGQSGRSAVDETNAGDGGIGVQVLIAGPPTTQGIGGPGPSSAYQYFAGGGGGGKGGNSANFNRGIGGAWNGSSLAPGPLSGGGDGGTTPNDPGDAGTANTGGGGGGAGANPSSQSPNTNGGNGGSGIVIVRYQIGEITANAKATGGAISFYGGKTIHTFTNSGSFDNPAQITDAEFVLVGGGGGGGYPQGGGGGAGGMVVHTGPFTIPGPATNAVVVGGGGAGLYNGEHPANPGTTTTLTFPGTPVTYSAYRGGGSGPGALGAMTGGSGGGGSYNNGAGKTSTNPAPNPGATEYGNAGANHTSPNNGGGGGGAGASASAGQGGEGRQLPTTYRNPVSAGSLGTPGPDSGGFYVAGGGAAFYGPTGTPRDASAGGGGGGPITFPTPQDSVRNSMNGKANTGGGGAGPYIIAPPNTYGPHAGNGASGIVLIAYPTT